MVALTATLISSSGGGMTAEYSGSHKASGDFMQDHRLTRIDPQIDFDWRKESSIVAGVPVASYYARWSGKIRFPVSGLYTLTVPVNAEIRLIRADGTALLPQKSAEAGRYIYLERIKAESTYGIVVTADRAPRMFLKWMTRDSNAVPSAIVPSLALTPALKKFPMSDYGHAYGSGSGKMTHFVHLPEEAEGMVGYTGVGERVDFSKAITPRVVTERSRKGYSCVWFTQRGLPNGATFPYSYKVAYKNPITGDYTLSAPTEVDFDEVDPKGIPWDTRDPNLIRAAILATTPELDPRYPIGILAPDGFEYLTKPTKQGP